MIIVTINVIMWIMTYILHQESKKMGVTERTNKTFLEPMVNALAVLAIGSVFTIIDILD